MRDADPVIRRSLSGAARRLARHLAEQQQEGGERLHVAHRLQFRSRKLELADIIARIGPYSPLPISSQCFVSALIT